MNIRKATLSDSHLLSNLCMDVQKLHAQNHPTIFKEPLSPDFAVPFFEKMFPDDTKYIYIAEENEQALGYIFFKVVERDENPFLFHAAIYWSIKSLFALKRRDEAWERL